MRLQNHQCMLILFEECTSHVSHQERKPQLSREGTSILDGYLMMSLDDFNETLKT